ncbi:hypothetical protein ABZY90_21475 [Streptomyces sp. NPDC006422]|uniref:hypothetical protein n=1 Tax=unclassified Streptomyces TaxID=2593676 RepID=UPI00339FD829
MGKLKKSVTGALAAVLLASGAGLVSAGTAEAAGAKYKCKASAKLVWGTAQSTSSCKKSKSGKKVTKHRAMIKCAEMRGQGNQHDIYWTGYGPWKKAGTKSTVKCPIRSSLAGYGQQVK